MDADVTLRRVLYELKIWGDAHGMLEDYLGYGQFLQVTQENERNFPLMVVNVTSAPSETWFINYNFEIMLLDYVNDEQDNRKRAMSNMREIANDLEETIKYSNRWQEFSRIDSGVGCVPAVEVGPDKAFGWIMTFELKVKKRHGICKLESLMPEYDFETSTVTTPSCAAASVANSDDSYSVSVASGGSLVLPDNAFSVNGNAKTANPATTAKAVTIVDQNDNPLTVTDVTDTANVYKGEIAVTTPINTANLYKDGQTTSFRTGDLPNDERGTDWWNLGYNNGFGNGKRFTGTTGGYEDEASPGSYYDKDGNATTYALAFPNDILLDWSQWNQIGETVPGINMNVYTQDDWDDAIDTVAASTTDGYSDWYILSKKELAVWSNDELSGGAPILFGYVPMSYNITTQSERLWSRTTGGISTRAYFLVENGGIQNTNKTGLASFIERRIYTYANLGL